MLERGWPLEFAPYDRRPIPVEEKPERPLLKIIADDDALEKIHAQGRKLMERLDALPPETKINTITGEVVSGPESKENGEPEMRYNVATRRFEAVETLDDDQS